MFARFLRVDYGAFALSTSRSAAVRFWRRAKPLATAKLSCKSTSLTRSCRACTCSRRQKSAAPSPWASSSKNSSPLAQAARLADVDRLSFQRILADHEIPLHYGMEELEGDLATIEELKCLRAQTGDKPWLALRGSAQFVGDPVAPVVPEAEINALQKEEGNAGS